MGDKVLRNDNARMQALKTRLKRERRGFKSFTSKIYQTRFSISVWFPENFGCSISIYARWLRKSFSMKVRLGKNKGVGAPNKVNSQGIRAVVERSRCRRGKAESACPAVQKARVGRCSPKWDIRLVSFGFRLLYQGTAPPPCRR